MAPYGRKKTKDRKEEAIQWVEPGQFRKGYFMGKNFIEDGEEQGKINEKGQQIVGKYKFLETKIFPISSKRMMSLRKL